MDGPEPQTWFNALGAAVVGVAVWVWNKHVNRVEKLEQRQGEFVTQETFDRYLERERQDRKQEREDRLVMHQDNTLNLNGLRDDVRAVHARIDRGLPQ